MNNINEIGDTPKGQYALGRVAGRAAGRKDYRKKGEFSRKDDRIRPSQNREAIC